jgi:hypothetical protein
MRILVACEFSGRVRDALIREGHDAMSCDLRPTESPGPHYQGDVRDILDDEWDALIAFPDCTYVASSGLHWNKRVPGRAQKTEEALAFVRLLLECRVPKKALENPIGCISTRIRPATQIVQPWMFGEDASKSTCLWLEGFEPLTPTRIIAPKGYEIATPGEEVEGYVYVKRNGYRFRTNVHPARRPVWGNQTASGQNKLGPSEDRAKIRSLTYRGIAEAMASQWK